MAVSSQNPKAVATILLRIRLAFLGQEVQKWEA
jgi:hypothetical protein